MADSTQTEEPQQPQLPKSPKGANAPASESKPADAKADAASDKDWLGYNHYATALWRRVHHQLSQHHPSKPGALNSSLPTGDPLVVGVYGEWGVGKTRLLELVHATAEASAAQTLAQRALDPTAIWPRKMTMTKLDAYELEVLQAFEQGQPKLVANKAELVRLRAAARATAIKDKRVNIRLSSLDLQGVQAKALEEGVPYQTLIASVLHKYVAGTLGEAPASKTAAKRQ